MLSYKLRVKGIVQGVGFRPFVFKLASKYSINGWVNNDDEGVNILAFSSKENIENFIKELKQNPPPLAQIDSFEINQLQTSKSYTKFEIRKSVNTNNKSTIISPDIAICEDCIADINDKNNFRFEYALTNCTNCGPRYSIIKTVPYDRVNTSMGEFKMCSKCENEYLDPLNRRYHAQPLSCEKCGPKISLYNNKNIELSSNIQSIKDIAKLINNGEIVAIKGLGGFHLVCDAKNENSVNSLRQRKNRPHKPFAVMFKNLEQIKKHTNTTKKEEKLLMSKEKPIVLVKKSSSSLAKSVAPNIDRLGCFIAYTPLHHLLFKYLDNPIVATSANLKDEPIIRSKDEIIEKLGDAVDFILDFNRDIINACDDSVVQLVNGEISKLRNARGYAPTVIKLEKKLDKKILALGANQKSTIALAFEDNLILSPHIGDLNSIESINYFKRTIETFKNFYDFEPDVIVCDKHPNYESTKWAKSLNKELVFVQHHYAHILSTMAEYNLKETVLGFAFDGTGYGDDGNIWGGEVFICDNKNYNRAYHLKYFKLLGAQKAVKEPKRVALSLLFEHFSLEEILKSDNCIIKQFKENEIEMFYKMWQKGLNAPLTSSMGRLFDGIASLANLCHIQSYEGQTGLLIEKNYDENITDSFDFELIDNQIDISKMVKQIVQEKDIKQICSKFINTLIDIIFEISKKHSTLTPLFSGGVFQNKTLLEGLCKKLDEKKFSYYYSKKIPLNDASISIGQVYTLL